MGNRYQGVEFLSESDVEQKFVYLLLTTSAPDGLGYDISDFKTKIDIRKISIDKGLKKKLYYPDFAVIVDGIPGVIVEVKVPGDDLIEAVREARLYATEINSSYQRNINPCEKIIVTDGREILGCYWDQDEPFIRLSINDLDSFDAEFIRFCDAFSKKAIGARAQAIKRTLRSTTRYFKPVHMLGGKTVVNEIVGDNSFGSNISIEYKYLFNPESSEDRASIIRNAYVTSKRKQAHVAPINKIIRAAIPTHIIDAREIADSGKPSEILDKFKNLARVKNEIFLLIGSVGSGKSTFTDYLRLAALPQDVANATEWINLNLNKAPLTRDLIYPWIMTRATEVITDHHQKIDFDHILTLKKIFSAEILKLEKGKAALYPKDSEKYNDAIFQEISRLQSDPTATLKGIINFLYTGNNQLLVIVLDNCDKRNREDQLLMFEVATWLKDELKCVIFLPIRDTTYDQFRNEPPLDTVIKDLVFRIDPPLLESVIYSRLNFATREIGGQKDKFIYYLPNNMKVECERDEVAKYLKSMVSSLFQDQLFRRIITGLAGRNIRKGLEILLDFCKSGHVSEGEILKIRTSHGEHKLPSHMIAKILLKGKRKFYNDLESNLKNLFDSSDEDALPDPFVRVAILEWLKTKKREYGPNRTLGFHKTVSVIGALQVAGHSSERVHKEISYLVSADCLISENQKSEVSFDDLISISSSGLIHLDLLRNLSYLATVAEDVFFRENQIAKSIANNLIGKGKFKVDSRQSSISSAEYLVNYLSSYHAQFFLGNAKTLNVDNFPELVNIDALVDYVKHLAENDDLYQATSKLEFEYPSGSQIEAQIVSIQDYGFFVEFGLHGSGLIHKTQLDGRSLGVLSDFEAGDWVTVEVVSYNPDHRKFDLKLISISPS